MTNPINFLSIDFKLYFENLAKTIPENIKAVINDIYENSYVEPFNDSIEELIEIDKVTNRYTDEERIKFANKYDDFKDKFRLINPKINIDFVKIRMYINYFIYLYKCKFNRLRPFMKALDYNKQILFVGLTTIQTPSYPSGHSAHARFLYRYFSDLDPKNDGKYLKILYNVSLSRIVAGVHYKSDCEQGVIIADLLYDRLKKEGHLNF